MTETDDRHDDERIRAVTEAYLRERFEVPNQQNFPEDTHARYEHHAKRFIAMHDALTRYNAERMAADSMRAFNEARAEEKAAVEDITGIKRIPHEGAVPRKGIPKWARDQYGGTGDEE